MSESAISERVLGVATHPDDEVLGCGGVMARHAATGDVVHLLVVSRGVPEIFPVEIIETSLRELRTTGEIPGTQGVTFLDFPAPLLDMTPGYQIADAIGNVIRSF